ncbi:hypothetical protein R1sor_003107 [Riccia sorocarpa]|uniref:G domain-containing protein n=1 Tax=Riccia sorocarpa TaxID=122646 RepID=A0ABD3H3Z1_9MARC
MVMASYVSGGAAVGVSSICVLSERSVTTSNCAPGTSTPSCSLSTEWSSGSSRVFRVEFSPRRLMPRATPRAQRKNGAGRVQAALMSEEATQVWTDLESEVAYLTRSARLVQWYPGHIAKAEKALKEQLKLVDVVVEVRDARIPMATTHPEIDTWIGDKKKIVVLNREDMVSKDDKNAWAGYYTSQGLTTLLTDGQRGSGIMKLGRVARSVAADINRKRSQKGLLPRAVRCAVVGYPNVGKSSVINRLLKRKVCETAPRPGVTRELRWTRIAEGLDLMDAPGVLPMRIQDQAAATRLAICNDIGEASYAVAGVASVLVEIIKKIPTAGSKVLTSRYNIDASDLSGEELLEQLGQLKFQGDVNQAALRVLRDFRKGVFGWVALERPPSVKGSNL